MSEAQHVYYSVEDEIGTIMLNRPEKLNALAGQMREELADMVQLAVEDEAVRVIVVTGAGRAFCAGADIDYLQGLLERQDYKEAGDLVEAGRTVVQTIREAPKPVIASVNGPAAGGGANLALSCDMRIASDRATIGQTFNRVGLHPDWGGTYFLPRLVGPSKALELVFSGEMVDAQTALELGIFGRVVPHDELGDVTRAVALELARKPPIALALAKQAIYRSDRHSLGEMLDIEQGNQLKCFKSADAKEGLRAFLEKRPPVFKGR